MSKRVNKRDREHAKRDRAQLKQARREERRQESTDDPANPPMAESDVLAALAELHVRHENEEISFDDFEVARNRLLAQLPT